MSETQKYEVGDYNSERGYYHICPVCRVGFWGRENKVYHKKCKSLRAKQVRKQREALTKNQRDTMWSNARILERYWKSHKGQKIPASELRRVGFDSSGPCLTKKSKTTGTIYYVVFGFAYSLHDENTNVKIYIEHELAEL